MKDLLMNRTITSEGIWVGRCHIPPERAYNNIEGPHVIWVHKEWVYDLSYYFKSTGELINSDNYKEILNVKDPNITKVGTLEEILENSFFSYFNPPFPLLPSAPSSLRTLAYKLGPSSARSTSQKSSGRPG